MTRIQQVVDALFERFPSQDLGGGSERLQFERLRAMLTTAGDWRSTLRRLYQADRCDEFALGLLWMTDRFEQESVRTMPSPEEEEVFQRSLRRGLGLPDTAFSGFETGAGQGADGSEPSTIEAVEPMAAFASAFDQPETAASEVAPSFGAPEPEDAEAAASSASVMPMGEDDGGTSDPEIYGRLLERFLEAVQSGADDRTELMSRLRANNRAIQSDTSTSEEFQRYAMLVDDFLGYIEEHQLLDDVRVMNLVTNLQEPFGQWLATDESSRAGILDQCVEMQRDFRTMFE